MRVRIGRNGELALTHEPPDFRPRPPLTVEQADPAVPEVVRREHRDTGRLAGPRDPQAEPLLRHAGEERRFGIAVLPRRQSGLDGVGENVGKSPDPRLLAKANLSEYIPIGTKYPGNRVILLIIRKVASKPRERDSEQPVDGDARDAREDCNLNHRYRLGTPASLAGTCPLAGIKLDADAVVPALLNECLDKLPEMLLVPQGEHRFIRNDLQRNVRRARPHGRRDSTPVSVS